MRPISKIVTAVTAIALTAGCASATSTGSPRPGETGAAGRFQERASRIVAAWEASGVAKTWRLGFTPLAQDRVSLPRDPGFNAAQKLAFESRCFGMQAALPLPPPPGQVRFPDGSRTTVDVMTAEDAIADLTRTASGCTRSKLVITAVTLGDVTVLTTRGKASAPAWLLTVSGLRASIAYMAVAPRDVRALPPTPTPSGQQTDPGLRSTGGLISVDGATVRFTLVVGSCDKDIAPLVYETSDVVALGGRATTTGEVCDLMAKYVPVAVTLAEPVGDRALIDGLNGAPMTVGPIR